MGYCTDILSACHNKMFSSAAGLEAGMNIQGDPENTENQELTGPPGPSCFQKTYVYGLYALATAAVVSVGAGVFMTLAIGDDEKLEIASQSLMMGGGALLVATGIFTCAGMAAFP